MQKSHWYICIAENVFGPLDDKTMHLMLQQNRLQLHDYVWCEAMDKWTPMYAVAEFAHLLPAYPSAPLPKLLPPVREFVSSAPVTKPAAAQKPVGPPKPVSTSPKPAPVPPSPAIRKTNRLAVSGKLKIKGLDDLNVVDLSISGVFVQSEQPLVVGEELKFELHLDGLNKPLDMAGVIVRQGTSAHQLTGYAFEFVRPNPAHLRLLQEFIAATHLVKAG
jgi:hypothetical protein